MGNFQIAIRFYFSTEIFIACVLNSTQKENNGVYDLTSLLLISI